MSSVIIHEPPLTPDLSVSSGARTDINGPPRPRLEDGGDWLSPGSQRKPWLPADFNQDIRPFDDLFGNGLDSTFADARTGGSLGVCGNMVLVALLNAALILWA